MSKKLPMSPNRTMVYMARDGWRWRTYSQGRIVAESGEAYDGKAFAIRMAKKYGGARRCLGLLACRVEVIDPTGKLKCP